jgi:hypothetical protein
MLLMLPPMRLVLPRLYNSVKLKVYKKGNCGGIGKTLAQMA